MNEEDADKLDKLVLRLDTALWEMELGNFVVDVVDANLYEKLIGGGSFTDCE